MIRRALLAACVLVLLSGHIAVAEGPVSLAQYRSLVDQAASLVEQATTKTTPDERQALLNQAALLLESVREVQFDSGARVPVDNASVVQQLRRGGQNSDAALARVRALRAALAESPASVNESDLARLREILSRPPFVVPTSDNWLFRFLNDFFAWLQNLLQKGARGIFDLRDVIVLVALGLAAVVVAFVIRSLRRHMVAEETTIAPEPGDQVATSGEALDNAQRFASAGDYRSAVRQLYLATLLFLDEHRLLSYDRSLTNREYLRQVAGVPAVATALQPIVETFDRTWYGFEPMGPQEFDAYREQVESLRSLAA